MLSLTVYLPLEDARPSLQYIASDNACHGSTLVATWVVPSLSLETGELV